jgi:hypothetical protein
MPRAVTFWRFPDEEARFLDYLDKTGEIIACTHERMPEPTSPLLEPRPIRQLIDEQDPISMAFGPRAFMDMAQIDEFELDGRISYGRWYTRVPLMAYTRGKLYEPGRLGHTNLVFDSWRSSGTLDDPSFTPQPPEFVAWGKRVLNWARRHTPRVVAYKRMTERVFAELDGGLELVP